MRENKNNNNNNNKKWEPGNWGGGKLSVRNPQKRWMDARSASTYVCTQVDRVFFSLPNRYEIDAAQDRCRVFNTTGTDPTQEKLSYRRLCRAHGNEDGNMSYILLNITPASPDEKARDRLQQLAQTRTLLRGAILKRAYCTHKKPIPGIFFFVFYQYLVCLLRSPVNNMHSLHFGLGEKGEGGREGGGNKKKRQRDNYQLLTTLPLDEPATRDARPSPPACCYLYDFLDPIACNSDVQTPDPTKNRPSSRQK